MTQDVIYPAECSMCMRRTCILLYLGGISYKYQLSPSGLMCLKDCVSLLTFCLDDLSLDESEVLTSHTITVLLLISPFMAVSICLIY